MTLPTPDFPDWTTPVASIEHDIVLHPTALRLSGFDTGALDTSALAQLVFTCADPAGAAQHIWLVQLSWTIGISAGVTEAFTFVFHSDANSTVNDQTVRLPVKGTSVDITILADNGADQMQLTVTGSTRPIAAPSIYSSTLAVGKFFLRANAVNVPAAGQTSFYLPASTVGYGMLVFGSANALTYRLNGIINLAGVPSLSRVAAFTQPAVDTVEILTPPPNTGARLDVVNGTGGALACSFNLWDAAA